MFKFLKKKPNTWLGIDITQQSIQMVELSNQVLQGYAYGDIPKETQAVSTKIASLVHQHSFQSKNVILAIPDALSISKVLKVSAHLYPHEIEACVVFDLEKHLPYALDDVYVDFQILGTCHHEEDTLDVLLVASKIQHVQQRVDMVERAGLVVDVVELQSHAMMRALPEIKSPPFQTITLLIDARQQSIACFVFENKTLIFLREEVLSAHINWLQTVEQVLLYTKRELQLHALTGLTMESVCIVLTGKISQSDAFYSLLKRHFNDSAQYIHPLSNVVLSSHIDPLVFKKECFCLLGAYGLALRGRNEYAY